jgi:hypothetical protein
MPEAPRCRTACSRGTKKIPWLECLIAISLQAGAALAQPLQCERLQPQKGELAYRLRGEYCEGLFVQDTSSSVRLKALIAAGTAPSAESRTLRAALLSPSPASGHRVRVQSLDPRIHYQLDAIVPASGAFSWSAAEVIERAAMRRADLAPLAWTTSRPVTYVPVSLGDSAPSSRAVRAIFETTVPVEGYVARLTPEQEARPEDLKTRSALPASLLEFDIPARSAPGRYTFWLRVRLLGEAVPEQQSWLLWLP